MKNTVFTGAATAIITPFKDNKIDYECFAHLIDWQIAEGIDAIVVCGTTGEGSTLSDEEHREALKFAVDHIAGRVPVIAGTGSNDTVFGIDLSVEARELGVDALLLVTPYYNKASQRGLIAHYNAIADAAKLPTILYNVPSRTGVNIQPATVAKLYENPYICAVKEASGDISQVAKIAAMCDIDIYSGNDDQIVPILSLGGKGVISVLSNVCPRETHDMCAKWFAGDTKGSADIQLNLLDLCNTLFIDVNPIPVKEALNLMGWQVGECRLPLCNMDDAQRSTLSAVMQKHGLID